MKLLPRIIKFVCSSLLSFGVDYTLCLLFAPVFGTILGNSLARLISASVNFTINRRIVFQGDEDLLPAIIKYALLAAFVLLLDNLFLYLFTGLLPLPLWIGKALTEFVVFLINFPIQGKFVYNKQKRKH